MRDAGGFACSALVHFVLSNTPCDFVRAHTPPVLEPFTAPAEAEMVRVAEELERTAATRARLGITHAVLAALVPGDRSAPVEAAGASGAGDNAPAGTASAAGTGGGGGDGEANAPAPIVVPAPTPVADVAQPAPLPTPAPHPFTGEPLAPALTVEIEDEFGVWGENERTAEEIAAAAAAENQAMAEEENSEATGNDNGGPDAEGTPANAESAQAEEDNADAGA